MVSQGMLDRMVLVEDKMLVPLDHLADKRLVTTKARSNRDSWRVTLNLIQWIGISFCW